MNHLFKIFLGVMALSFFAACREDVPELFHQKDGVYISSDADSLFYTFAKYPHRIKDTLKIPISVLGDVADKDRQVTLQAVDSLGNPVGVDPHYELLTTYSLPAGEINTTLPVVIFRTEDLDTASVTFYLKLLPGSDLQAGISNKMKMKVQVGFLQEPPLWGEFSGFQWAGYSTNFGSWTKTKYKVILDALYDPVSDTTVSEFPANRFGAPSLYIQYLQIVKNYIKTHYPGNYSNPLGIGATLRDPDAGDAVIQVGPANY